MRNFIVIILALVLIGYVVSKASTAFKVRNDLTDRVVYRLDFVDESSTNSVKDDVVHDAQKLASTSILPTSTSYMRTVCYAPYRSKSSATSSGCDS